MYPYNFPGAREIKKPDHMTDEQCGSMPAMDGHLQDGRRYWLLAYMPSYEDRIAINAGGHIYLRVPSLYPVAAYTKSADTNLLELEDNTFLQMMFKPSENTIRDVNNGLPIYFNVVSEWLPITMCFTLNDKNEINE